MLHTSSPLASTRACCFVRNPCLWLGVWLLPLECWAWLLPMDVADFLTPEMVQQLLESPCPAPFYVPPGSPIPFLDLDEFSGIDPLAPELQLELPPAAGKSLAKQLGSLNYRFSHDIRLFACRPSAEQQLSYLQCQQQPEPAATAYHCCTCSLPGRCRGGYQAADADPQPHCATSKSGIRLAAL